MAAEKAQVTIRGGFPAGVTVALHDRVGDFFAPGALGKPVKTAKVSKDGEATFSGLREGAPYWAVAEYDRQVRHRAVTAKVPPAPKPKPLVSPEERLGQAAAQAQSTGNPNIVTGARGTANVKIRGHAKPVDPFANKAVGEPSDNPGDSPAPRLEDAPFKQVASDTLTGEAVPVAPENEIPTPRQEDVPKGTPQESDTERGTATVIEDEPETQEEAGKKPQRSSTEKGTAEVVEPPPKKAPRKRTKPKAKKAAPKKKATKKPAAKKPTTAAKRRKK